MDFAIIETGNGGDLQIVGNDIGVIFGIENQPYLGMFGGNVEQITKAIVTEIQSFDYWGNNLFYQGNASIQFNSLTENMLRSVALNSKGRTQLQNAIEKDLEFLQVLASIEVTVIIVSDDRIRLQLLVKQDNISEKIIIINFKKQAVGDFWIFDFNDDFFL